MGANSPARIFLPHASATLFLKLTKNPLFIRSHLICYLFFPGQGKPTAVRATWPLTRAPQLPPPSLPWGPTLRARVAQASHLRAARSALVHPPANPGLLFLQFPHLITTRLHNTFSTLQPAPGVCNYCAWITVLNPFLKKKRAHLTHLHTIQHRDTVWNPE